MSLNIWGYHFLAWITAKFINANLADSQKILAVNKLQEPVPLQIELGMPYFILYISKI